MGKMEETNAKATWTNKICDVSCGLGCRENVNGKNVGSRGAQCNSSEEGRPANEILASAEVREPARRMTLPVRENMAHLFPSRKHQLNEHKECLVLYLAHCNSFTWLFLLFPSHSLTLPNSSLSKCLQEENVLQEVSAMLLLGELRRRGGKV
uniref:Uncharacterized protein n=1 Tax=Myotis myotis TaxID=51298 RepID=A0A7J7SRV0_MYOMY|nr:hypothetical protein mMyoMyo1_009350 [Myotis myotis]